MLLLVAPDVEDPRDGGFTHALAGELVCRPQVVCDAGREARCGCERSWSGVTSSQGTTLALVADKDMTPRTYERLIAAHLMDAWDMPLADAEQEARMLADVAADFEIGDLVTIGVDDNRHVFEALET